MKKKSSKARQKIRKEKQEFAFSNLKNFDREELKAILRYIG